VTGRHTPYKFAFVNPLNEFAMIEFVSSKPSLMELRHEKQGFDAHEIRHVELFIPPQSKAGTTEEVLLYINDESGRISETLLFKLLVKDQ
jgi:hypothetical protein